MNAIHRKLIRDLWAAKGQCLAIAAVIGSGIAMFIMYLSAFDSLRLTQSAYYERYRFADVFANCKRAPERLAERITEIPGVARVDTRVVVDVTLDIPDFTEPATGRLLSIPEIDRPTLNDVVLRKGRYLEPGRSDEVLINEGFALAHGLQPGDSIQALINGRLRTLDIVGIAMSPEYIYSIRPGEIVPDDKRFGVFWMERRALAAAFDMEGGFNDVAVKLTRTAQREEVIARIDRLLEPYGGLGALPRDLQLSHWTIDNELQALQGAGLVIPIIFLSLAAFLLNVALTRIVSVQREQIAALKALGYTNAEIGLHFTLWSLAISLGGAVFGVLGGAWMGGGMVEIYNDFFRFPFLTYRLQPAVILGAVAFSIAAACLGAWRSVRTAVNLPPAEAMRPEPPAEFKVSLVERLGLRRLLSPPARMVLRNLSRRPGRTFSAMLGIAFACAIYVAGIFSLDSMDELIEVQFNVAQRQDLTVTFVEPTSASARYALESLPGVMRTETARNVSVRLKHRQHQRQTAITGIDQSATLNRVVDADLSAIQPPPRGLVLSRVLAEALEVQPGDQVIVEVLEGRRPTRRIPVVALVDEYMGAAAYMRQDALHALMREAGVLSGAYLMVDANVVDTLYTTLKRLPQIAGVALKSAAIDNFHETIAQNIGVFIFFNTIFAAVIAFGVVYNAARISLSERSRELASLRVLGMTRGEISQILLGELATLTLVAIPTGLLIGHILAAWIVAAYETELYRLPLIISTETQAKAAIVVLIAAAFSGLVVRRKLDSLDLVEVLKTRE